MSDPGGKSGSARWAGSAFEEACAVADAILYEGYLLYPYRRSSPKNRVRWQFGVLAPRAWAEAHGPVAPSLSGSVESWQQQTECLVRATPDAVVQVRVRYLQTQSRGVERRDREGRYTPVDSLEAAGTVHLAFDEAVPRDAEIIVPLTDLLAGEREFEFSAPGGQETETLPGDPGRLVRRRCPVEARTTLRAERLAGPGALHRLRVRTENTGRSTPPDAPRDEALRNALIATHTFIGGEGLGFLSSLDPPDEVAAHVRDCRNLHTFPVLAGEEGTDGLVLSSPIILPDHPQVAPESPGDLHDAAEIDEILTLRTLVLTDDEKREARATDPRAARILERVETMPPEVFARLHGAIRSLTPSAASTPSLTPSAASAPSLAPTAASTRSAADSPGRGAGSTDQARTDGGEVRPSATAPDERATTVPDQEGCHGRHRVAEA
ncbi:hypothetical protein ACFOZ0_17660 [Streptomyces yaanensis]|uniref:Uncharacterized protein n=1 Tax=Streptomyces yaanensis TaxID=1142239 RepID=A0ABV7SDQ6_9ACTN|nr:hypothetical protein [Streptomyces sp. CGMCC 4.7035]WNB99255.1 hypothetical protein Q2K21_14870 [Streptomyces sp. CGMCC 4.7035]